MKKLLTGVCALALGAAVLAGCTERSDRVGGTDRDRTLAPSASPGMRPSEPPTTPTPPLPPPAATDTPKSQ